MRQALRAWTSPMQPHQKGHERFALQMTASAMPNGSITNFSLDVFQLHGRMGWICVGLLTKVFDLKSSRSLYRVVQRYARFRERPPERQLQTVAKCSTYFSAQVEKQ